MTKVWEFKTGRIAVTLEVTQDSGYQYDGDDDGSTQEALDNGDYVAFNSAVTVYCDGQQIGVDHLGGSVYEFGKESEFWTAHRGADPMNRNCSIQKAATGSLIGHYFPDMVREAIGQAREALAERSAA